MARVLVRKEYHRNVSKEEKIDSIRPDPQHFISLFPSRGNDRLTNPNVNNGNWPLYKIENDPRKTKIGTFIEKYSIDELPQFFNVIIWNMSLVWPRPHQPREVNNYAEDEKRLLTIKPWITWMAQVNGRDKNDFSDEVKLDLFYIENWSILLDIKIIIKTFIIIIKR